MSGNSGSHNAHARLAPSAAERWTSCTMSVSACGDIKDKGSVYADEGTQAHDWAEKVLSGRILIDEVPEDFRSHVKFYTDHCESLLKPGFTRYVESKVPLFYSPQDNGTMDFAAVSDDVVRVRDYKHGAGVLVDAVDNPQLAIYALSLIRDLHGSMLYEFHPATLVDIGIVQPRHHADNPIRLWVISLADLEKFCEEIEYRAIQIREGRGLKYAPSENACRWCPIKARCEARVTWLTESLDNEAQTGLEFLALLPDLTKDEKKLDASERIAGRVPDETLVKVYERGKAIAKWLDDVEEYLQARAESGNPVEGTKLVMGREGNRAWADEDAADAFLKNQKLKEDQRYNFKLKSPTQIEELLSEKLESSTRTKNLFLSHITRSPAKSVVALATDKRPAVNLADGFEPIEDDVLS